jgi:hypothetical protein
MLEEEYGLAVLMQTQVYMWHKRFHGGLASANHDPHCRRPLIWTNDEKIERVHSVMHRERRKSVQEISAQVGISLGSVHGIL